MTTVHLKYKLCKVCKTNYCVSADRCWLCFITKKRKDVKGLEIKYPE